MSTSSITGEEKLIEDLLNVNDDGGGCGGGGAMVKYCIEMFMYI